MRTPRLTLGLETSSRLVGVALVRDGELVGSLERFTRHPQADDLRQLVEQVLADARVRWEHVTGLAVSIGPGSFTGLRIGVSFVKGLAAASGLPIAAVPTLDVIAQNAWGARGAVTILLDAKQGQVYAGVYRGLGRGLARCGAPQLGSIDALRAQLKRGTLFVGDGVAQYATALRRLVRRPLIIAPQELWWPRAATVARLGASLLARGRRSDPLTLTPLYLYADDCSIKRPLHDTRAIASHVG